MSLHNAIQSAQEGGYVNGPFEANVSYPETKTFQDRTFFVAKLTDGPTKAKIAGPIDFSQYNGKRIVITTPFKKPKAYVKWKKSYQGTPELGMGEGAVITLATGAQDAQQHSEATQAFPTNRQSDAPVTGNQTQGYDGATVGCAAHCAARIVAAEHTQGLHKGQLASRHYELMSEIIKNMGKVQAGVLYFAEQEEEANPPF